MSFVWTRGLASSLLPFTRRQPIKPPDSSTSKGSTESTQETVIVMSSAPSSTEAKDVSVDLMKGIADSLRNITGNLNIKINLLLGNNENENKHSSSDSDHLEIPAHIHVPAKRNSSTLDKETLEKVVVCPKEDLGNQFSFPQVQFEDYIDPIVKKPKLEVLPPAVLLLDGSGDGLHNKQYGKVSVKVNKEKRKHSKKHNKHYKGTGNGSSEETDESMPMNHFIAIQMSNPEVSLAFDFSVSVNLIHKVICIYYSYLQNLMKFKMKCWRLNYNFPMQLIKRLMTEVFFQVV